MGTGEFNAGGNPAMDQHLIQGKGEGGVAIAGFHMTSPKFELQNY